MCIGSKKNRFNLSLSVGPKKDRLHYITMVLKRTAVYCLLKYINT